MLLFEEYAISKGGYYYNIAKNLDKSYANKELLSYFEVDSKMKLWKWNYESDGSITFKYDIFNDNTSLLITLDSNDNYKVFTEKIFK